MTNRRVGVSRDKRSWRSEPLRKANYPSLGTAHTNRAVITVCAAETAS